MERRIAKLEDFMSDTKERLVRIERRLDDIEEKVATRADISALEVTMLKWFIGTALTLSGLVLFAARFIK